MTNRTKALVSKVVSSKAVHAFFCLWLLGPTLSAAADLPVGKFVNPIAEGADPSVVKSGYHYYWCQSDGNVGISINKSDRLHRMGPKHLVWKAPASGPFSKEVWAPELIHHQDRWYVYFAASDGQNKNHLTYVLASKTSDALGEYTFHGPLYTGEHFESRADNLWAIDMTLLDHQGQLYGIWSGWSDATSDQQYLYIAPMESPTKMSASRTLICDNADYVWERTEEKLGSRGLHEGPQILKSGQRTFLVYSCAASWLPTYKLGMLELVGQDPLSPKAWRKFADPVFQSTATTYGVGHGSFVPSPDGKEWWHFFHVKRDRDPGWRRSVFVQPMAFDETGLPEFGKPVDAGRPLNLPSGSPDRHERKRQDIDLGSSTAPGRFDVFSHHQLIEWTDQGVALGRTVPTPINEYRCGEKLMLRNLDYNNLEVSAEFTFQNGNRDVGIVFRATGPSVGYDAVRGYFAGLIPGRGGVVLGKMDGANWHHLADQKVEFDSDVTQRLTVKAVDDRIDIFVNDNREPSLTTFDNDYTHGSVGIRVVDTHAVFHNLVVTPQ